jgi:hypothetical protein
MLHVKRENEANCDWCVPRGARNPEEKVGGSRKTAENKGDFFYFYHVPFSTSAQATLNCWDMTQWHVNDTRDAYQRCREVPVPVTDSIFT